jgi:hypothetical protein
MTWTSPIWTQKEKAAVYSRRRRQACCRDRAKTPQPSTSALNRTAKYSAIYPNDLVFMPGPARRT